MNQAAETLTPWQTLKMREKQFDRLKNWKQCLLFCGGAALLTFVLVRVVFGIALVRGESMKPAYTGSELLIFLRLSREYQSGDIVILDTRDRKQVVKRIVGVPGDRVEIDDQEGSLILNGRVFNEPYIYQPTHIKNELPYPVTLRKDEYFVLGDQREKSRDSRAYGAVSRKKIKGKVVLSIRRE